jgi:hypothetical protein
MRQLREILRQKLVLGRSVAERTEPRETEQPGQRAS